MNKKIDDQLSMEEKFLANEFNTLIFNKYASFKKDNPTEEERAHLHATWHRKVSTLSKNEKLALIMLKFFEVAQIISYDDYSYIYGCIIYQSGDAKLELHDPAGYEQSFYIQNHALVPDLHTTMVNEVFKIYGQVKRENPAILDSYLSKYISKGASWFKDADFDSSKYILEFLMMNSLFLGQLKDSNNFLYYCGDESLITIAPPGSGKTQCNVLPNLMIYPAPAIILDVKGDCYNATSEYRKRYGSTFCFSPLNIKNSSHYNPFYFMSSEPLEIWQEAQKLSKLIIVPNQKSDHWDKRAMDILTAIIAYVKLEATEKNMTTVCDYASATPIEFEKLIVRLTSSTINGMRRAGNALESMLENNPKQFEGVLDTMRGYLGAWQGDNISAITNKSDWHINDFMRGENKPSLYLIIPPAEIETYAPVLRVIIGQHLNYFLSDHDNIAEEPILFMLDEMPRLGKFDLIPQALDTGRSYNIKLWMFAQYVGQLKNAYGQDIAEGLMSATGVKIYMNPSEDIAQKLSNQLGECDDLLLDKKLPLASALELTGREFADDMIIISKGEKPVRAQKKFFGDMVFE